MLDQQQYSNLSLHWQSKMFNWELLLSVLVVLSYGITPAYSENVNITDYPYHVSVEYNNQHSCSGVLIIERWVLTVAACVYRNGLTDLTVRVATSFPSSGGEQLEVRSVIIHEDFDSISYENDIALLQLNLPLEYGDGKLPIVLPSSDYEIADETLALVTGWVVEASGSSSESQLTVVRSPIINQTVCSSSLPVFKELTDAMLCAGYMSTNTEVCQGDIGGPLVYEEELVGLLSYGLGCSVPTFPSVYTRISSFVPWILNYTGVIF